MENGRSTTRRRRNSCCLLRGWSDGHAPTTAENTILDGDGCECMQTLEFRGHTLTATGRKRSWTGVRTKCNDGTMADSVSSSNHQCWTMGKWSRRITKWPMTRKRAIRRGFGRTWLIVVMGATLRGMLARYGLVMVRTTNVMKIMLHL